MSLLGFVNDDGVSEPEAPRWIINVGHITKLFEDYIAVTQDVFEVSSSVRKTSFPILPKEDDGASGK